MEKIFYWIKTFQKGWKNEKYKFQGINKCEIILGKGLYGKEKI